MKEQEKTVRVRVMTREKLDQEYPQTAAKIRAAAELIKANRTDYVIFHTEDGERKVAVSEIMYYMTDDRKLSVHTADGSSFQLKMTMKDLGKLLNRESFLMLHRGCVVNRLYVRHILNGAVELTNGERLSCIMVFRGKMTAGALMAVVGLNSTACSSLSMLLKLIPVIRGTKPVVERLNGFADEAAGEANDSASSACPSFQKKLEVRNLTFGYRPGEPVLQNLSFSITPGEKCALIGPNGSGKTTLIRLLTGELDGYEGEILYDGAPLLTDVGRDSICAVSAVIHQEVFLFEDTIRNNICLWQEFSGEEFERAIRLSGVKDFAVRFAEGVEYQVGQRGVFLSGGQRQRVAIARALIRNTPLLILDEGMSALDEATAVEIEEALLKIPELTLITITHHLKQRERYSQVIAL